MCMKNITLSADPKIIAKAREKAKDEKTSLNNKFREWLDDYANISSRKLEFELFWSQFDDIDLSGRKFTREEMNER